MATARNGNLSNDPETREAELLDRLVASAAGLPRVCVLKRCRRRKRCLGPIVGSELLCKRHHRGLAKERFQSALEVLGWPNCDNDGKPIVRQSAAGKRQW
jgi:hypothetical protein